MHSWLVNNCFKTLGDRVWKQVKDILMGFSCSLLWCNIYLMTYEVRFIQRLAKLSQRDLMTKFSHAFQYIDNIYWLNVGNLMDFLSPTQPRISSNPFWIYLLQVLEIKPEVMQYAWDDLQRSLATHFMNMHIEVNLAHPGSYSISRHDKGRALPFMYT